MVQWGSFILGGAEKSEFVKIRLGLSDNMIVVILLSEQRGLELFFVHKGLV
jgi:hypothetical protein